MADPLALYAAVMGRLWEDERVRGQAQARIDARLAGRRQGRSYARTGRLSARNIAKAATGRSRAAIFKRIRAGGCKTRASLGHQLSYVSDKAVFVYSTMTNPLDGSDVLTEAQKEDVIEAWAATWRGTTKLGFTSHMLLSFPDDVSTETARDIALDWAEHFFESGLYGDRWDYVLAVHDDRAHRHAHIVLNNRGSENGTWFSCWAEGVMSPQLMREKQAEIAEGYGVMLDATTRLERGIFARAPGIEEIYRAKAEARLPREIALTPAESAMAQAQVAGLARDYTALADLMDRMDRGHLARAVRTMTGALGTATRYRFTAGEIDMKDIRTVGDAIDYSERTIEALRLKAEELDSTERAAFEIKAAPIIRDLSTMVPDPDLRARFGRDLAEPYPPGAGDERVIAALEQGHDGILGDILSDAWEAGIDGDALAARIAAGGTTNYGLAQDWVERDMAAVLAREGLTLTHADDHQLAAALGRVDAVMDRLMERTRELGLSVGDSPDPEATESTGQGPNARLQEFARVLRQGYVSEAQEATFDRAFREELTRELGDDGLAQLREGNYAVLAEALPARIDQIAVTQDFLEMSYSETGDQALAARSQELQDIRMADFARKGTLDRDLGDELDL